jgi:hypothetical protein
MAIMIDVQARFAALAAVTGNTNENFLINVGIPGGLLGPLGVLRVNVESTQTNNANAKTIRVYYGGTVIASMSAASAAVFSDTARMKNQNAVNSQITTLNSEMTIAATNSNVISSINSNVYQPLVVSVQLAVGGDTLTLDDVTIEYMRPS